MTDILTTWQFWAAIWAVCGWLAYGATMAHFQRRYPNIAVEVYNSDKTLAITSAMAGPIGLTAVLFHTVIITGHPFHHGFMWRVKK